MKDIVDTEPLTLASMPFDPDHSIVAVLGAGVMGPGIALVFAQAGYQVLLCEVSQSALDKGLQSLQNCARLKAEEGLLQADQVAACVARVTGHVGIEQAVSKAHLVIEAVSENKEIKRAVFETVGRLSRPETVVWSNTSTLNVFELAPAVLEKRLLVAHWFAPAHIVPLVEVVGNGEVSNQLVDETLRVLRAVGKSPVRLNRMVNGFVINRILRLMGREIFYLLESGVISAEDLDLAVRTSIAPRMQVLGVVQRYDFTGLNLSLRNYQDPDFKDPPFQAEPEALREKVQSGHLGISTGQGFFDYGDRTMLELQDERDRHLHRVIAALGDYVTGPRPVK